MIWIYGRNVDAQMKTKKETKQGKEKKKQKVVVEENLKRRAKLYL
jgi:hypothetical protein